MQVGSRMRLAGAHILSGCALEPRALDELLPDWKDDPDVPIRVGDAARHMCGQMTLMSRSGWVMLRATCVDR